MWCFLEELPEAVGRFPRSRPCTTTSPRVSFPIFQDLGAFVGCLIDSTAVNLHRETGITGIAGVSIETLRFARGFFGSRLCLQDDIISGVVKAVSPFPLFIYPRGV
jgi:hypothetical protein